MEMTLTEAGTSLLESLDLQAVPETEALRVLSATDSRYIRELKMNLASVLESAHLTKAEALLLAYTCALNAKNDLLAGAFRRKLLQEGVAEVMLAEAAACASLLSANNVLYRFRHFTGKEKYQQLPARLRMNVMLQPQTGKELFELMSLAVSAVNGCEMCVTSHEQSLIGLGCSEERIFDAIRVASMVSSASVVLR